MRFVKPHRAVYVKKTLNPPRPRPPTLLHRLPRPSTSAATSYIASGPSSSRTKFRRAPSLSRFDATRTYSSSSAMSFRVRKVKHVINRMVLKNANKAKKNYCMFFCRFGKCQKGDECPFEHDPSKVAICTRFLRGTCRDGDLCLFSHSVTPDKMPVCSFFLRGTCNKENCPYRHVNVGPDAEKCQEFLKFGHCSKSDKCQKLHILSVVESKKATTKDDSATAEKSSSPDGDKKSDNDVGGEQTAAAAPESVARVATIKRRASARESTHERTLIGRTSGSVVLPDFIPISSSGVGSESEVVLSAEDCKKATDEGKGKSKLSDSSGATVKKKVIKSHDNHQFDSEDSWIGSDDEPAVVTSFEYLPDFLREKFIQ